MQIQIAKIRVNSESEKKYMETFEHLFVSPLPDSPRHCGCTDRFCTPRSRYPHPLPTRRPQQLPTLPQRQHQPPNRFPPRLSQDNPRLTPRHCRHTRFHRKLPPSPHHTPLSKRPHQHRPLPSNRLHSHRHQQTQSPTLLSRCHRI